MGDKVRLNHELLIWVGFTRHGRIWTYPDGVDIDNGTPYFPEDETACFKWLVPIVSNLGYCISVIYRDNEAVAEIVTNDNDEITKALVYDKTPALALCLAIQKLIRSK